MIEDQEIASKASLIAYFENIIPLSQKEKALVSEKFQSRFYQKKQYVLQEGDISTHMYFVVHGCLRMYKVDNKGSIHIIHFAAENWWMSNIGSFYSATPSEMNIDALENTLVLHISYNDLTTLYVQAPKFNLIFRVLIENNYVSLQKRLLQNISSTAEDRYNSFLETYSHLANRLPQNQIAAFLGITPEFVSRLRSRLNKSNT
ncbi:Crp/Fnr family transcriptional regulator [Flavobacterium sp. LS1R47]|uniref:Crp/Fnr family transcriptional regulator n=1 Tax=Flavobacterium frigoritolerans TaxID=2987686 RepID=A0A9X3HN76_9FLAO|nr:Crp/Fnr family transcriptional regulator [Flavobacterium frigoritolerans]MCV9934314.1 Crp/Fnr family transcriptional regulator [Flavobacterium frigoritolerans]